MSTKDRNRKSSHKKIKRYFDEVAKDAVDVKPDQLANDNIHFHRKTKFSKTDSSHQQRKNKHMKKDFKPSVEYDAQSSTHHKNTCPNLKNNSSFSSKDIEDLIGYYKRILQTFKNEIPIENRGEFAANALGECEGFEVEISCHKISSHCIELLLTFCEDRATWKKFWHAFSAEKERICTDPLAAHITEKLICFALRCAENWQHVLEMEYGEEKEFVTFCISWLVELGDFIAENMSDCLQNQYACHVVCTLISALAGDTSKMSEHKSKKAADHKKNFQDQYISNADNENELLPPTLILEETPVFFSKMLKRFSKILLHSENIIDFACESSSATVIECLSFALQKRLPKTCEKFIRKFSSKVFAEKNSEGIPQAFLHKYCSFVVENLFRVANEETQQQLWEEYFSCCLDTLIGDRVGNYIVQRLFEVVESKSQFERMCDEIGPHFDKILKAGNYSLFISISNSCLRLKTQQAQFMKNIMHCLNCSANEDQQLQILPCLLGFQLCSPKPPAEKRYQPVCLHGSLLIQSLLKFQKPIKLVNSMLHLKAQDLSLLACHSIGCHVLNVFFSSSSVGEKSKDKLIQNMKPALVSICCDRNGSLTLARIWVLLSIKQKHSMAETLGKEEKSIQDNHNGNITLKKFGIFYFKHNYAKWKDIQSSLSQRKQTK